MVVGVLVYFGLCNTVLHIFFIIRCLNQKICHLSNRDCVLASVTFLFSDCCFVVSAFMTANIPEAFSIYIMSIVIGYLQLFVHVIWLIILTLSLKHAKSQLRESQPCNVV